MADGELDRSLFTIPNDVPVSLLDCKTAFDALTAQEKQYAHYLAEASFNGGLIVLLQTSPESPAIFLLFQHIFTAETVDSLRSAAVNAPNGPSETEFQSFLVYIASFLSNMGNYKSFGDSKFVPALPQEKLDVIVHASAAYRSKPDEVEQLWRACGSDMYNLSPRCQQLGLGAKGVSTYYSSNVTEEDCELVQEFMTEKKLSPYNSRLFKSLPGKFELRLASSVSSDEQVDDDDDIAPRLGEFEYKGKKIRVVRGDYSSLMQRVVDNLCKAKDVAANDNERSMLEAYVRSFRYGSIDAHKDGSRHWIRDRGPVVESYIGFIESYRDPYGVRGEFEGFVAVVNKAMSAKFATLVNNSTKYIPMLPWPASFEKDSYLRPDFTSLDVVAFGGSGIPAGINIPNYDDIRQNEGFKNVSLGNVLSASATEDKVTLIRDEDQDMFKKLKAAAFEVQVGLHELLGHGSGKLFQKAADGTFNFDPSVVNPLTGEKVLSWYEADDTWDTKFLQMASSYEECRAECVGLYLCLIPDILSTFGHDGPAGEDVYYVNWLLMVRAGLMALEYYSPEIKSWRQAHMQARYVILQVLLEAGEGLVSVNDCEGDDGKPNVIVHLNRDLISSVGKKAIEAFLCKLQVYKSTADVAGGHALYNRYSSVTDDWLALRNIVLARKQARRMFVQAYTKLADSGEVSLIEPAASAEGMVDSFTGRFPHVDADLTVLWQADHSAWDYTV